MIVQQGAFISVPLVVAETSLSAMRGIVNPYNTACIALSIASIGIVCFSRIRQIGFLALKNVFSVLFILIVLLSAIWSIHPDLTIRRGIGYVLTMLIAGYLSVRFDVVDRMKVLSWGFAVSAIGSLLFVAAFPQYGIMQLGDLSGNWRGVFPHKNVLGPVMAVAVFTELCILVLCNGRPRWRLALLGLYFSLVLLSHSATALLLSLFYLIGTCIYLLWKRERLAGVAASIFFVLILLILLIVLWHDPQFALGIIEKDITLTGRTKVWGVVFAFIEQRPWLGWGYRAMWGPDDALTTHMDRLFGWGAGSSHNAFLEITLQLGLLGLGLMLVIIGIALWRGVQCCRTGILPLGWFSLMFFLGAILAGQTIHTLGQNQVIEWVVFNVLMFSCGLALISSTETSRANVRQRLIPRTRGQLLGRDVTPQVLGD
jgi:O-antigen ligase